MDRAEADYRAAAEAALAAFPIEPVDLTFVNLGENVVFRVNDGKTGAPFVLRLHRPWYHDVEALKSEHLWTRALTRAGISVPEPIPTRAGEDYALVDVAATGERRWAGLARWIAGEVLFDIVAKESDAANEGHFERLGAIMAAMHNQASVWTPPTHFKRHALDEHGLMGESPFWGPFWDHAMFSASEREVLLAARGRLHGALTRLGKDPAIYSVIHADLHPGNVLIDAGRLAVIDFDDAAFGWHMYDLAVGLVFQRTHANFAGFRDACVRGYRSVRPLADRDLALLDMFLLARNLVQVGWLHQRPELATPPSLVEGKGELLARAEAFEPPL